MNFRLELLLFLNWSYEKELPGFRRLLSAFLDVVAMCQSGDDVVRLPLPPETSAKSSATFLSGKRFLSDAIAAFPRVFSKSSLIKIALISGDAACTRSMCQYSHSRWSDVLLVEMILDIQGGPRGYYTGNVSFMVRCYKDVTAIICRRISIDQHIRRILNFPVQHSV